LINIAKFGATHEVPDLRGARRDLNLGKVELYQLDLHVSLYSPPKKAMNS